MHHTTEKNIQRFLDLVPANKEYYLPQDLQSAGFPTFITERIRLEIADKLENEFQLTDNPWTNVQSTRVKASWKDFQNALQANIRIPQRRLKEVVSGIISEIVQVLIDPRSFLAEYIYRDDDSLTLQEVRARSARLTVYKHFAQAIPLYMDKRGLGTLDKERCQLLIQKLDANLAKTYSENDWCTILDPLFKIGNGTVHADLLCEFFEGKELYQTAAVFKSLDKKLTPNDFVDKLKNADLPDASTQIEQGKVLKGKSNKSDDGNNIAAGTPPKDERLVDNFLESTEEENEEPEPDEEDSFNALFKTEEAGRSFFEEFDEEEEGNQEEVYTEQVEETEETEAESSENDMTSLLDEAADSYSQLFDEEDQEDEEFDEEPELEEDEVDIFGEEDGPGFEEEGLSLYSVEEAADDEEETPMWQQFLSPDQLQELKDKDEEEEIIVGEDDFVDDLIDEEESEETELSSNGRETPGNSPGLKKYLSENETLYVHELFNGSEKKYNKALKKIQKFDQWKEAAPYIHKKVFTAHNIDMFSDKAVEFTDGLQSYFKKFKT
ncbi:hypothetical protein [Gracilimonas mengyeensis]|uniref:Uncharacterized protein n=1 Tax=Gracilimonas mengyeensis TaxID=1302730 RepID=A0A521DMB1_9BACT|nr:hypothetical protein [Gracilimonas mengyeensis]SMO72768.1 hypothetical protein SAMN06265219_10911 [Gracilimonas mengyeensis]